jgi:uncharacterized protein YyaL (SSP411 family)
MRLKKSVVLFWGLIMVSGAFDNSLAQKEIKRYDVLQAINECSNYAATVLLDKNGESRCDYNMTEGKWYLYEPPWHTGQIINALVKSYQLTKNEKYLMYAKKAGDWWCSLQIKNDPKLNGMLRAIHGDGIEQIVFATITDGTPGLFNLYRVTGIKKYAEVPTGAGKWMLEHMYLPDKGIFYDVVDPKTGEVLKENSPFWPEKTKQTLYDVARPNNEGSIYKDMYEYTKNEKYKKVFIELCESLVNKQDKWGLWMDFMPNDKETGTYHPRFNLWYAESLLDGFDLTGDKRYLEAAKKTLLTYQKAQRKDGTIYYVNHVDGSYREGSITGSAVAFAGILWIRLIKAGAGDEFKSNVERSASWIISNRFSAEHPDKNLAGAVINLRVRHKKGKIWMTQRDVGTSFGIRFLVDYYQYKFGEQ